MKAVIFYLLQVIISSGILYGYYHFFLRNKKFHQYNRYYLLVSVMLSIAIPFLNIPLYFTKEEIEPSILLQALTSSSSAGFEENAGNQFTITTESWFTPARIAFIFYILVAGVILIRLLIALVKIYKLVHHHPEEKMNGIRFINTEEPGTPFSFFRLLFWNKKIPLDSENGRQVFRHELYHIRQNHTWDVIVLETVRMIFWINPFFHLICKEIKVIHEFLADKFAANKNEEWNYAELLLMQLLGSPDHRLVNPFFHNQIKRRIAMITSSKKTSYQYLRKLLVLPVAAVITALFAFNYKAADSLNFVEKPVTVVIDAGHGTGSGAIAPDGTPESDLTLIIAKKVQALNKNRNITILLTRESEADIDLRKRSTFSNSQKADMLISIHVNNAEKKEESGFDVYIPGKNKRNDAQSRMLGSILLKSFANIYTSDKEVKLRRAGIWVLDESECPAVLVECGNLTNQKDLEYIKDGDNQDKIANSILQSIGQFAGQNQSARIEDMQVPVSDTIYPMAILTKDATGKIIGTYYGSKITGLLTEDNQITGFVFEDGVASSVSKGTVEKTKAKYLALWTEFVSALDKTAKAGNTQPGDNVFERVEIEASFPGGDHALEMYLDRNMNEEIAAKNKAPEGTYTVWVEFIVHKDGSISNIKPLTSHGFGMEKEAIKLFSKGPRWVAALHKSKPVNSWRKQPVTFVVHGETKSDNSGNRQIRS